MNNISLRFKEVLEYLISSGVVSNNKDFATRIGISTSMITEICKGRSNVGSTALQNIVLTFPIINALWLLTGIGSMLQEEQELSQSVETTMGDSIYYNMYKEGEKYEEIS